MLRLKFIILDFSCHVHKLLKKNLDDFEALYRCDGVDQHITMNVHGVLGWKDGILILASCVNQFDFKFLTPNFPGFGESVLDGGIV